jgi:multiple sugar transport system substrate-binding protein
MLWIRTDLMQKAGIDKIPTTWDELRSACQKMHKGGVYGAPLPYAANSMTTAIFMGMIHRAGGQVFTPDLQVAIDSEQTLHALDFYSSMKELCPPGASSYSWLDSLKVFVAGVCATAIYSGRVLHDVYEENPAIQDNFTCTLYPTISKEVPPWTFNTYAGLAIPKQAPNLEVTKKFAVHLYRHDGYLRQLLADPGHDFPVLKSIDGDPEYTANPLIKKYQHEVEVMTNAGGFNLSRESAQHKRNLKGGEVTASGILGEIVQRVCLNHENPKAVLGDAAQRIEQILKS